MAVKKRKKSSTSSTSKVVAVDFSKETAGGRFRIKEGSYKVKFTGYKFGRSKEKETPYVQVALLVDLGKGKTKKWDGNRTQLYLTDKSLWRLRSFFEAMDITVPRKKIDLRKYLEKAKGKELGIDVVDGEPYEGRISSEIADFIDLETLAGADEEDEDDEDEEDEDDEDEEDEDEDEEEDDEDEEEFDEDDL